MKCKLLIVDDEIKMLKYTAKRLTARGYEVDTAASGEEALALIKNTPFEVVLLDVLMPIMGGIETLREIKKIAPHTAVILVSGHNSADLSAEGQKWGAFDYLLKPYDLNALMGKIDMAIQPKNE
jgi:DNA-binding NtrC family response regulator